MSFSRIRTRSKNKKNSRRRTSSSPPKFSQMRICRVSLRSSCSHHLSEASLHQASLRDPAPPAASQVKDRQPNPPKLVRRTLTSMSIQTTLRKRSRTSSFRNRMNKCIRTRKPPESRSSPTSTATKAKIKLRTDKATVRNNLQM